MGIILKNLEVLVAAKMWEKFRGSTTQIPENRSKFPEKCDFLPFLHFCPNQLQRYLVVIQKVKYYPLRGTLYYYLNAIAFYKKHGTWENIPCEKAQKISLQDD